MSRFLRQLTRGMAAEMSGEQSDRQLVERLLVAQDNAVFETLVRRHGPMVYRVCWRVLQHAEDTEDAFQATFLLLARKLRTVRKRNSLASWLHGVAHRVALDARAQAFRRRRREQRAVNGHAGPPDEIPWSEFRTALDAELEGLAERWRLPLILCYLEGRSQEEAAKQLGWSKRTLLRRLDEARTALGRRLTRRGVVWPAAASAVLISDCVALAALPLGLVGTTVEAAGCIAAGHALDGIVSTNVTDLLTKGMQAMVTSNTKSAVAALLVAGVLISGALGIFTIGFSGKEGQAAAAAAQDPQAAPKPEPQKKAPPDAKTRPDVETALAQAVKAAAQMPDKDALPEPGTLGPVTPHTRMKVRVLGDIANAQLRLGNKAAADKTLEQAAQVTGEADIDIGRHFALIDLATAQWRAGRKDASKETFQKALDAVKNGDADQIKRAAIAVVLAQQECGDNEGALSTWKEQKLDDVDYAAFAGQCIKCRIATDLARAGDIKGARSNLDKVPVGAAVIFRQKAVTELVRALVKSGDRKAAEDLLKQALAEATPDDPAFPRAGALTELAIAQAFLGDKAGAARSLEDSREFLRKRETPTDRDKAMNAEAYARLAEVQAELGDRDGAKKTVELALATHKEIAEAPPIEIAHSRIMTAIANAQIKAGDGTGALKTVDSLTWEKGSVFEQLALTMTLAGESNRAAELTTESDNPLLRARAFLGIARGLAQLKTKDK
jgi:RNA polymerase sigma factor (sigma-70 family)